MILDQRHMSGTNVHRTVEDVRGYWSEHAETRAAAGMARYPNAPRRAEPVASDEPVTAYISAGRWVADCLGGENGLCKGGIACWPEHDEALCLDCGTLYKVEFPRKQTIDNVSLLLAGRPVENRNWKPGERARELQAENEKHGIV